MKVRVSDNEGTWLEDDGSTIVTVWTSNGWRSLPGEYDSRVCSPAVVTDILHIDEDGDDIFQINIPEERNEYGIYWTWVEVNPDDFEEVE